MLNSILSVFELVLGAYKSIGSAADVLSDLPNSWLFRKTARLWQPACIFAISCVELVPWGRLWVGLAAACWACCAQAQQGAASVYATTEGGLLLCFQHYSLPFKLLYDMHVPVQVHGKVSISKRMEKEHLL